MRNNYLKPRPYLKFAMAVVLLWTAGTALSVVYNLKNQETAALNAARVAARTAYEKDVVYRMWNSMHGGVYVPVGPAARPNVYLEGIPDRELETSGGKRLTLMNPAYMNRQVHEIERSRTGSRGHLTSLRPVRPENAPDAWEKEALEGMVTGDEEYSGVQVMDGREYMRYMRPLVTEEACLKCHERHGYSVGQIRGGLSVSTPMEPFRMALRESVRAIWFWHVFTWFLGIAGIFFSVNRLTHHYRRHEESEQLIRDSLEEKEVLLREIHHRVKNNLQVISGMLDLQAATVKDKAARTSLMEGRNRVMSMALIHQKLYQSQDIAHIRMDTYFGSLVDDLFSAFGLGENDVHLKMEVEGLRLNLDTAIPFGLLVSELVTNALKYAFPSAGGSGGKEVAVSFREDENGFYILSVSDNGVGLPQGFDPDTAASMGLKLVHSLVGQLGGEITLDREHGTSWTIVCPHYEGADDHVELPGD